MKTIPPKNPEPDRGRQQGPGPVELQSREHLSRQPQAESDDGGAQKESSHKPSDKSGADVGHHTTYMEPPCNFINEDPGCLSLQS